MSRSFLLLLLRGFGSGFTPGMPGTVGSLLALVITLPFWPMSHLFSRSGAFLSLMALSIGTALLTWCGFRALHQEWEAFDPSEIVLDEFAGTFLVIGLLSPVGHWPWNLLGFVLFRLLDMVKPFPIDHVERQDRFIGLVGDDLVAAVLAAAVTVGLWLILVSL